MSATLRRAILTWALLYPRTKGSTRRLDRWVADLLHIDLNHGKLVWKWVQTCLVACQGGHWHTFCCCCGKPPGGPKVLVVMILVKLVADHYEELSKTAD
eukprot:6175717-Pleurochrysis_carterae.AAC.3